MPVFVNSRLLNMISLLVGRSNLPVIAIHILRLPYRATTLEEREKMTEKARMCEHVTMLKESSECEWMCCTSNIYSYTVRQAVFTCCKVPYDQDSTAT